jgi:ABC-type metal ion transport system, periplasmic component/surface adhesin
MKKVRLKTGAFMVAAAIFSAVLLAGCSKSSSNPAGKLVAVGAENEYADIISQIGGQYVSTTGIMSNPETDPHSYEADTKDASVVGKAALIVENGLGYDDFMDKLESGSPNSNRTVIDVAKELKYPDDTENPHLWFKPDTMPRVAKLVAQDLEKQMPSQKQYFEDNLSKFDDSLSRWTDDLNTLKQDYAGAPVAVTEPVADYLVEAAGLSNKTPWAYQAAVMNGTDPSPQDIKTQQDLFNNKQVKVFLYNRQAVDDSTTALLTLAKNNNIPVVGVYETMPTGYTYQKWMEAETEAVIKALKDGTSTETLS